MSKLYRSLVKRWRRVRVRYGGLAPGDQVVVSYGPTRLPHPTETARGGIVKFQQLQPCYPHSPHRFNILYLGSSSQPDDIRGLIAAAKRKGARLVWNQDGVGYPGWCADYENVNRPMAHALHAADHVFYQSDFCRRCADRFLGPRAARAEVLYNAVDTDHFRPAPPGATRDGLVLLLGGTQYQSYRFEAAVRTLAVVLRERGDARLLVTGSLCWDRDGERAQRDARACMDKYGVTAHVMLAGAYSQQQAPALFQQAHLLLHPKYNDPCPKLVLEAMACGLPVVYSASGGVPELVGEAGVGIATEERFDRDLPPDPAKLAEAILQVAAELPHYAQCARERAVAHFDARAWVARHREVFEELIQP